MVFGPRAIGVKSVMPNTQEHLESDKYWKMARSWWYPRLPWAIRRRLVKHDGWSANGNRCPGATIDAQHACVTCLLARIRFMNFEHHATLEAFQCGRCRASTDSDTDFDELEGCDECEDILQELHDSKLGELEREYPCLNLDGSMSPREVLSDRRTDHFETELYGHMLRSQYGPEITSTILNDMIERGSAESRGEYVHFMLGVFRATEQEGKRSRWKDRIFLWTLIVAAGTLSYVMFSDHWRSIVGYIGHIESLIRNVTRTF